MAARHGCVLTVHNAPARELACLQGEELILVHEPQTERELAALRRSVVSGRPCGSEGWVKAVAQGMGLSLAPMRRGRPPKKPAE